jgi:hypothetical protein
MDMNTNQKKIDFRAGVQRGLAHPVLEARLYSREQSMADEIARVDLLLSNQRAVLMYELDGMFRSPEEYGVYVGIQMRLEILKELRKLVAELEEIDAN